MTSAGRLRSPSFKGSGRTRDPRSAPSISSRRHLPREQRHPDPIVGSTCLDDDPRDRRARGDLRRALLRLGLRLRRDPGDGISGPRSHGGGSARALIVFWLVWWAWTQFTWSLNEADTEHGWIRLITLVATALAFLMAVTVPSSPASVAGSSPCPTSSYGCRHIASVETGCRRYRSLHDRSGPGRSCRVSA